MIASPSTKPGKTSGSEARLSSIQRPGTLVRTTIHAMTAETSMTVLALPIARTTLFQTVFANCG